MALAAQTALQVSEIIEIRRVSHEPEGSDHRPEICAQLFGSRIDRSFRRDRHFSRSARKYDPRVHQNRKAFAFELFGKWREGWHCIDLSLPQLIHMSGIVAVTEDRIEDPGHFLFRIDAGLYQ